MRLFAFVVAALLAVAQSVDAQCIGGRCPVPGGSAYQQPAVQGAYVTPPESVCMVQEEVRGGVRYGGTGTLVCVGADYGVVLTAGHVAGDLQGKYRVIFANGRSYPATCIATTRQHGRKDRVEFGLLRVVGRPVVRIMRIAAKAPLAGARLWFGGYGSNRRFRKTSGVLQGYSGLAGDKYTMQITGASRGGDSGGPIVNEAGELVGVLWGTNGRETVGSYQGKLEQWLLTSGNRFVFPWNADLAKQQEATQQQQQQTEQERYRADAERYRADQIPPPVSDPVPTPAPLPVPTLDLQPIEATLVEHAHRLIELEKVAEAARLASEEADTAMGTKFAELLGATEEAQQAAEEVQKVGEDAAAIASQAIQTATGAGQEAAQAKGAIEEVEKGLVGRVREAARGAVGGLLAKFGWPAVGGLGAILALLWFLIRRDIRQYIETGGADKLFIQKLAARTPWGFDDRVADLVGSRVQAHADPGHGMREEINDLKGMVKDLAGAVRGRSEPAKEPTK